jgi:hypothetical protein
MIADAPACPPGYLYSPSVFDRPPAHTAAVAYVVGGLYGNVAALEAILAMREAEERQGRRVLLIFNGDHNWLNVDPESFRFVNETVLAHSAIRGNVESEIAAPSGAGCGCNYPAYVSADHVARSNAIMDRLQAVGRRHPAVRAALGALPMTMTIVVGGQRIAIVHGDAEALSGWSFAAERLSPIGTCCAGDEAAAEPTPVATIERWFRAARVTAFASSHTCLAHARDVVVDGARRLIINNGAAGLPNFAASRFGLITRIAAGSASPPPPASLYGVEIGGVRYDALPVHYDHARFLADFLANWPPGSPAYEAYFTRILRGPDFTLADAVGGTLRLRRPVASAQARA